MAKSAFKEVCKGNKAKLKKYFYALRPVFSCIWIQKNQSIPPIEFEKLLDFAELDKKLELSIKDLLKRKRQNVELGQEIRIQVIDDYLQQKIIDIEKIVKSYDLISKPDIRLLDDFFRDFLEF